MMDDKQGSTLTFAAFTAYQAAFFTGALFFAPYALVKMLNTPAYRAGLSQRLSLKIVPNKRGDACRPVWIQAVSLGEVKSVAPLIRKIAEKTDCPIRLTTTTETGHQMARELFSSTAGISYFPLDFRWATNRILSRIRPRVLVLFETEIWPNLIKTAVALGIPVVVVNGRISESSSRWYRLLGPIFHYSFSHISRLGMQSASDAERAVALGAEPGAVSVCGNMKFDAVADPPSADRVEQARRTFLLPKNAPLIVGGSTHEGEEKALLHVLKRIQAVRPEVRLLLAPRHPERFDDVEAFIHLEGFKVLRRSNCAGLAHAPDPHTVILLDTIGELAQTYSLSSVSFVGGSLTNVGGHNIIEPASLGKPVVFGPYMHHFKDIKEVFLAEQAAVCVASEEELYHQITRILKSPTKANELATAALRVVKNNRGATNRYFALLKDFL
jgi:3-deoxy-D-manno-octulosonic-acid transferase